mgnify:CR=1 FL=1|tara:strand:+ start:499 stop:771 length:273 start_codon:yes stop_codon:yes gene_type:complete
MKLTPLQVNDSSKTRTKGMLDHNIWLKHKIETEPINDLAELKVFLDENIIFMRNKLNGIQMNRKMLKIDINKERMQNLKLHLEILESEEL